MFEKLKKLTEERAKKYFQVSKEAIIKGIDDGSFKQGRKIGDVYQIEVPDINVTQTELEVPKEKDSERYIQMMVFVFGNNYKMVRRYMIGCSHYKLPLSCKSWKEDDNKWYQVKNDDIIECNEMEEV
jgi:hypothetical protein